MRPLLYIIPAGLFAVLCSFAFGRAESYQTTGYTKADRAAMQKLVADSGVMVKTNAHDQCGLDWLCLIAEADKKHRGAKQ